MVGPRGDAETAASWGGESALAARLRRPLWVAQPRALWRWPPPLPAHPSSASSARRMSDVPPEHARPTLLTRRVVLPRSLLRRLEKALRRFRKASNISGHLRILRNRKTFESAHDKAIRKNKEGAMRRARARRSARNKGF